MSWSGLLHFFLIYLIALVMAGLQTTVWFQIFGSITAPLLWLVVFTYVALYREGFAAAFQLMVMALMLAAFSGISVKTFYLGLLIYFIVIYFVKSRVFWSGSGYFLMMVTLGAFTYHVIFYILSYIVEKNLADLLILERLTQILLTPSFAIPLYWLLTGVDGIFIKREIKTDLPAVDYD